MTIKEALKQVESFQKASQQIVNERPSNLPHEEVLFRDALLQEESRELRIAGECNDKVEILDGLADCLYVLLGTVNAHGMQHVFEEAFKRVCESNNTKLTGGKLIKHQLTGKVLKPDTFVPVDLKDLV